MPIILPASIATEAERPQQGSGWVWLWRLTLYAGDESIPEVVFRICSWHEVIQWPPSGSSPPQFDWYPFPFSHSLIEETRDGDLPQLELSLDNSTRVLSRYMHDHHGFEGMPAELYLVNEAGLAIAYPNHEYERWAFRVASASATEKVINLRMEMPNFLQRKIPQVRFHARRCRWVFGSEECGYPINSAAAFTTCGKTIADCVARGADEATRRLPVLHPRRFGGFPGIPRQRNL